METSIVYWDYIGIMGKTLHRVASGDGSKNRGALPKHFLLWGCM